MINDLQNHLQEALQEKIGKTLARVAIFPDDPKGVKPLHAKCDILIHYPRSEYKEEVGGFGLMKRTMYMEFRVVTRAYSGKHGAIAMLEKTIAAMWNYQPVIEGVSLSVLQPAGEGFISLSEGIWQYFVRFKTDVQYFGQVSNEIQ